MRRWGRRNTYTLLFGRQIIASTFEEFGGSLKSSRYSHHMARRSTLRYLSREIKAHVSTVWFPKLETIEKSISRWKEKLYYTHTMEYLQLFCCCSSFLMVLLFHALSFFSIFVYIAFSQANIWAHNWKDTNNKDDNDTQINENQFYWF